MLVANRASTEVIDLFIDVNNVTFTILLHVHCAPFLSFSTIYVLLQFLTLLASMHIAIFRHFVFLVLHSDSPLLRRPIFPTMQNRTQSTNPWFNQMYPTGCSVGQANLDEPCCIVGKMGRRSNGLSE
jgi:hypothetical protein